MKRPRTNQDERGPSPPQNCLQWRRATIGPANMNKNTPAGLLAVLPHSFIDHVHTTDKKEKDAGPRATGHRWINAGFNENN